MTGLVKSGVSMSSLTWLDQQMRHAIIDECHDDWRCPLPCIVQCIFFPAQLAFGGMRYWSRRDQDSCVHITITINGRGWVVPLPQGTRGGQSGTSPERGWHVIIIEVITSVLFIEIELRYFSIRFELTKGE